MRSPTTAERRTADRLATLASVPDEEPRGAAHHLVGGEAATATATWGVRPPWGSSGAPPSSPHLPGRSAAPDPLSDWGRSTGHAGPRPGLRFRGSERVGRRELVSREGDQQEGLPALAD